MEIAINKKDIIIPEEVMNKWQDLVEIVAKTVDVPAALIAKTEPPYMKILCSNKSDNNPYRIGAREFLADHYSVVVLTSRSKLLVTDAYTSDRWDRNTDLKMGFNSYLGYPIHWPDGDLFDTFYVLDTKVNEYGDISEKLMFKFNELIESNIALLYQNFKLQLVLESMGDIKEGLKVNTSNATDAIITADYDGNITFWNHGAQALFNYSPSEALRKPLTFIVSERFRNDYQDGINHLLLSKSTKLNRKVFQWTGIRKDGLEFPIELTQIKGR